MSKLELDNLNKIYENKEDNNHIKYEKNKNNEINNIKISDKTLKFFPELKLIDMKKKRVIETPDFIKDINFKNLTIFQNKDKNMQIVYLNKKNNSIIKKNEFSFPKINSVKNKNTMDLKFFKKNTSLYNNFSPKLDMNNNRDNKTFFKKNSLSINNGNVLNKDNINKEEINIKEKNIIKKNGIVGNLQKKQTLVFEALKSKIKVNNNIQLQKMKIIKNNSINKLKNINQNSTFINNFKEISKNYNSFNNNKILNGEKIKNSTFIIPAPNNKEVNSDKLNLLNNLFNILNDYSPSTLDGFISFQKNIVLNSKIFKNKYKNLKESVISNKKDIKKKDYIKGYGYNSCIGHIRNYNEDEITVTKIYFNNDRNDYSYYFGLFDGHGGKGCSNYLKKNLHKNIKEFSVIGVKIGIDITEERFITNEAVDEKGEIKDSSGSCGIILIVKDNKCIIANIGDSRLIIIKNKLIDFTTMDHKPDSIIEKSRIELAGGKIYKDLSLFQKCNIEQNLEIPWWVSPGRLSVSRAFGDIKAKDGNYGGNRNVIICLPDITEIILDDNYNFIIIGCDGIFDVLNNEELLECINIVIKEKKINININNEEIHQLCGDIADMIVKSALEKYSFDNLSCIVIGLNIKNFISLN